MANLHRLPKNTPPNIVLRLVITASYRADAPGFGALTGSAASEGVFASSLDVRWIRTSALDLPPRKAPLTPPPAAAPLAAAPLRGRSSPRFAPWRRVARTGTLP